MEKVKNWIKAHPIESGAIAIVVVVVLALVL